MKNWGPVLQVKVSQMGYTKTCEKVLLDTFIQMMKYYRKWIHWEPANVPHFLSKEDIKFEVDKVRKYWTNTQRKIKRLLPTALPYMMLLYGGNIESLDRNVKWEDRSTSYKNITYFPNVIQDHKVHNIITSLTLTTQEFR